jgi:DNA processing protein
MEEISNIIEAPGEEDKTENKTMERIPQLSAEESLVFEAIDAYPVHIDDLARKLFMKPGKLSSILLQLELKGIVHQSPGKLFSREAME